MGNLSPRSFSSLPAHLALLLFVLAAGSGCGRNGAATAGGSPKEVDASALNAEMQAIATRESTLTPEDDMIMSVAAEDDEAENNEVSAVEADGEVGGVAVEKADGTTDAAAQAVQVVAEVAPPRMTLGDPSLTAGIPGEGPLTEEQASAWLALPGQLAPLEFALPLGLAAAETLITGTGENPLSRAKIELGRQLYFDTRLSADGTVSCATCHDPAEGYSRHTQFGEGIKGQKGNRNSPVSFNRILSGPQFWDGRAVSLEEQAKGPVANPIEMGNTHEKCVASIRENKVYQRQFALVFPGEEITIDTIAKAIATFERAIVTGPTPYDYLEIVRAVESQYDPEDLADLEAEDPELHSRYLVAKTEAGKMSAAAIRGRDLFFDARANCTACHAGANFTDEKYHNLGVGMAAAAPDLGRFTVTQLDADKGAFKTPGLRNVASSAPYMHDGSQATLEEVVKWYVDGGHPNPYLSDKVKKLDITADEQADLVAFMKEGLTGAFPDVRRDRLPE